MRVSVNLPDDLVDEAKRVAKGRGVTFRELLIGALRSELGSERDRLIARTISFPIVTLGGGQTLVIDKAVIDQIEFEDDLRRSGLVWGCIPFMD